MPTSVLFDACHQGNCDRVRRLIEEKSDVSQLDEQGRSALHYCAENSHSDCAELLLKDDFIKVNILDLQDQEGCSALHLACMNGNEIMVTFLCRQGADVQLVDKECHSLIHWITVCGHVHLFNILVHYKAPVHTADIHDAFPVHYASQLCGVSSEEDSNKGLAILQKFIDRKVDIDCVDRQTRTPFMWAASAGAINALRLLYKYGANQLHVDKDRLTALHCAATHGHTSCIEMLVEQCGCALEGEDINGCTALFYAITLSHPKACQLLLRLYANPNHKDTRGRTPSHCAILKGNLECLKYLIEEHANIWIRNKRGDYPIHEVIQALGTTKDRRQANESSQIYDVIRYIFQLHPKRIHTLNDDHRTPLHLAASLGDIEMCEVLIGCGARINSFVRTLAGNYLTPYDLARVRHEVACADYLVHQHGAQRGNFLAKILARRIQKYYRAYRARLHSEKSSQPLTATPSRNVLMKQAKLCLDNKRLDDRTKAFSLNVHPALSASMSEERNAEERRRVFAKSRTTMSTMNRSDESKVDPSNKVIIHTSNSIATSNKLYDRRKFIMEELYKIRQARVHNHYIVVSRPLYKILIENAFNPQNRRADEIEKYLDTLVKAYDTELDAIRKRTQSVPPKQNRRSSQLF